MTDIVRIISAPKITATIAAGGAPGAPGDQGIPGVGATKESIANKRMTALNASADGSLAVAVAVTNQPVSGYVGVRINGVDVPEVGDGSTTGCACYFSGDNGVHARAWGNVSQGDTLHWVATVAGFSLATTDVVDFLYEENV
jgi:hypothetical protein